MKDIEKLISPLIENQFPQFYREDGPQFVAFVKAYYEWLENNGSYYNYAGNLVTPYIAANNNVLELTDSELANADYLDSLTAPVAWANSGYTAVGAGLNYHGRRLSDYKDIDTTIDDFILQFKEKYLKNIQFDTATNKRLLVKNALDLYRSKGTEQSIDLFFKLVYGTAAEVKYPADNILRVSDGIWERPEYLEVTYSQYNINYVGKQVIGALSGAKAFVEKYIRRRVGVGYVNLLYITGREGEFRNGEVIGINVNNTPDFTKSVMAQLVGSVKRVTIETKGRLFNIGDIVTLEGSDKGSGGLARVASVSAATGLVDFIFIDGGWGYTLNATSLISEKVVGVTGLTANTTSDEYFRLFDQLTQPLIKITHTSATANLTVGDAISRYASNGMLVATGSVVGVDTGAVTIAHGNGTFVNTATYYTTSNAISFYANTVEDHSIAGKVMDIPQVYMLQLKNQTGTIQVGQNVYQKNTSAILGRGTVNSIVQATTGNVVILRDARGVFKNTDAMETYSYTIGAGTITTNSSNTVVVGSGTAFDNNYIGSTLYRTTGNVAIGTVDYIINATSLSLQTTASVTLAANAFNYALQYPIFVENDSSIYADIDSVSTSIGIYDIKKYINTIKYSSANNAEWRFANNVYQYNAVGNLVSKGIILSTEYDSGTGTGNLTFIPVKGYFKETDKIYTPGNSAVATVVTYTTSVAGGDYVTSPYSRLISGRADSYANVGTISYGHDAGFGVATIGDTEVIFIGTDLIGSNNTTTLDYDRKILTVASSSGFAAGDAVYQTVNKIAFNANSSVNATSGFITLPSANTLFTIGDNIKYEVSTGNTALNGMIDGDYYHVRFANTTGLILSYPYRKTDYINTSNFSTFANNQINESGHYLYKVVYGTVFETATGVVKIKDRVNYFSNTGGTANTTTYANSNLVKYTTPTTNTNLQNVTAYTTLVQANQAYAGISIRSAAYGFPKNPQGDLADTIYSCLNFGRFEIGTIGALSGINPGAEYNVDPFVRAYQPYISAFDRKDFIISIDSPTRSFVTGERVNQTLANLEYYDLKVSSGVYSNTYDEIQFSVNTKDEVLSGSDFILAASNSTTFNANTGVNSNFITISGNPFLANDYIRYYTNSGNTALTGLSNNAFYYIGYSNSSGVTISATPGGANIALTPSTTVESGHNIVNYVNDLIDTQRILYRTPTSNTVIAGLANNTAYYIVSSNTIGFKLSSTLGGSAINITAAGTPETHVVSTVPGYLPGDRVYQSTSPVMNASVQSVFSNTTGYYVRVQGNTASINVSTSNTLYSYTNPYVNASVSSASLYSIISTAKGIVQAANSSTVYVKRLTFENTFTAGSELVGDVSGAHATITGVSENDNKLYPIGLNADIAANVITSNGQVTSLDIYDSGFGYSNGEIVDFISADRLRAGTVKIINDGSGMGKGYYRSSKGFISEDMYIHDGDYYQEYSYEVLTKISVDRYSDMFKKVMHMAGTKFFGSALIIEEANVASTLSQIATSEQIQFNAATDVSSTYDSINVNVEGRKYEFDAMAQVDQDTDFFTLANLPVYNPSKLIVDDLVRYTSNTGHFLKIGDGSSSMSNNSFYYVVFANTSGVKLSTVKGGSVLNVNTSGMLSEKHILQQFTNPFSDGDTLIYTVDTGNTVVTGLTNYSSYYAVNSTPNTVKLSLTANGSPINITASATSETGHYLTKTVEE